MRNMDPSNRPRRGLQRKRDAGMIEVRSLWAYPVDVPAIRKKAASLARARKSQTNPG